MRLLKTTLYSKFGTDICLHRSFVGSVARLACQSLSQADLVLTSQEEYTSIASLGIGLQNVMIDGGTK